MDAKDPSNRTASILIKGAMIDDLLRTAPAAIKDEYGWKIDVLRARLRVADPAPKSPTFKLLDRWSEIKKDQFKGWFGPLETIQKSLTYEWACKSAGVPLPPNWNSGQWALQGTQPQNRLFLKVGDPVEVYAYKDPNTPGACIALPRWSNNKKDVTLGVICQSKKTGKACFWDNRPHTGGGQTTFTPREIDTTKSNILADWVNGYDADLIIGGKCVMCHRGYNVFVIHPGTPLDLPGSYKRDPDVRYAPITNLGWINPPQTHLGSADGCKSCHEIGNTKQEAASYCEILKDAANREMPSPTSPAGWNSPASDYAAHIAIFKRNCPP